MILDKISNRLKATTLLQLWEPYFEVSTISKFVLQRDSWLNTVEFF